jgi:hypothetical protein
MMSFEFGLTMTDEAFGSEECDPVARIRAGMRIMTGRARHLITAHALAHALAQLLNFADSSGSGVCVFPYIKG